MEAERSSEISIQTYQTTKHHIPEDGDLREQYGLLGFNAM
jgi:hypothetical protein